MKEHYETILCPGCKMIELVKVIHTFPRWTMLHTCSFCKQEIADNNWQSTGHIFNADMLSVLRTMRTSSVDVVITDPPYGVRKDEEWDDKKMFLLNLQLWLEECLRVSKHTVVWFCANRMFPHIFRAIKPENFLREHHWKKPKGTQFAGSSNNRIWYSSEPILVFTKDKTQTTKNFDEDIEFNYDDLEYDTISKKIWNHPTVKPVGLIAKLVQHYSLRGQTILDPFAGSGTLAEACIKTGREYICIEQDPDHHQTMLNRIKNINSELSLFGGAE